jgi:hypothetical protein
MEFNQKKEGKHEITDIFPLAFYRGYVNCHQEVKNNILRLKRYNDECFKNRVPFNLFHHEEEFKFLFPSLRENFNFYIKTLGVDCTKVSYHVVKSWIDYKKPDSDEYDYVNEIRYDMSTEPSISHWHNHSDLTFVYYVCADETSDKFYLENQYGNQNDFDAILEASMTDNILTEWNKYNTKYHVVQPEEGTIMIFPSKLYHFARRFTKRIGDRIIIAGDIKVTSTIERSKQKQTATHPSLWREL